MAKDEDEEGMPDQEISKDFYAKYEPKEVLGRGISSTVRRCIEKETGREYAVKIIDLSGDAEDPDGLLLREASHQEIGILRAVNGHPYIIELIDVFESSTFIFLIFELCKNGELFDYLTSVVTLSEKRTKQIMKQLFEAVLYIHNKNIVHRDLKPENILLDDNLNVKLTDFGFAKTLKLNEKLFDLCGTPGYLAPELLRSSMYDDAEGYSKEVDVWACGVIMYTLLVGCPPFWHRKQMIMLRNIMEGRYTFSSPEWDDISDTPKDLISKLLVVDPKKRINITEALKHPFFQIVAYERKPFIGKKKFKTAIICIRAIVRLRLHKYQAERFDIDIACKDPYKVRALRKVVDACAFRIYGHWVKKGEAQNRAALFENHPKLELISESNVTT